MEKKIIFDLQPFQHLFKLESKKNFICILIFWTFINKQLKWILRRQQDNIWWYWQLLTWNRHVVLNWTPYLPNLPNEAILIIITIQFYVNYQK